MPRPEGKTYGPYRKSYIVAHGNGYKFHRTVPHRFRRFLGKTAWIAWLGNVSRAAAEQAADALRLASTQELQRLERLKPGELEELASAGGVDKWRAYAAKELKFDQRFAPFHVLVADLEPDPEMPDHMQDVDILASARARRTLVAMRERKAEVARIDRTLKGEGRPALALLSLVALWEKARPQRTYKSAEKSRLYVTRFVEVVGDLEPTDVRRTHVMQFRDALEAKGYSTTNISQHLAKLQTLFKVALSEGVVTINPADGVKARRQARDTLAEDDKDFTADQVRRIFKGLDGEAPDFQWIVKLLAYHGARSKEICQLRCADVTTLQGVSVIRIHDRTGGSVKNRQSVRDVPIHPKCKGIIAHAAKIAAGHGADSWLFPSLTDSKQGRAHNWQNYANRKFLRVTVGIVDRQPGRRRYAHSMHSLRHRFSTRCRETMPEAVKYALMGHSLGKGEGGKYGTAPSLKLRAKAIAKVDPLKG